MEDCRSFTLVNEASSSSCIAVCNTKYMYIFEKKREEPIAAFINVVFELFDGTLSSSGAKYNFYMQLLESQNFSIKLFEDSRMS